MQLFPISILKAAAVPGNWDKKYIFACWAIVIVLLAAAFAFLRSGRKRYAVAILPLLLVPFVHIFSGVISRFLTNVLPLPIMNLRVLIDCTAGLVSCLLLGLASRSIEDQRTRVGFFWCCAGFVVILTLVLVTNIMVHTSV